jgi:hypothetical protein
MEEDRWTVDRLLKISGSFWESSLLHAAVALEIFTLIGDELLSAEKVAAKLDGDLRGTTMLLNGLTAMELLSQTYNKALLS